jgi:hypothetical protein
LRNPQSKVFLTLAPVNKSIKFCIKRNENYFFCFLFLSFICLCSLVSKLQKEVGSLVQTSDPAGTVARMHEWFTHACNSNQLIILASKEGNLPGRAAAGGEVEGDGWALLAVVNPTCCSRWSQGAVAEDIFQMSLQWRIGRISSVVLLLLLAALGKKRDRGVDQDEAGRTAGLLLRLIPL